MEKFSERNLTENLKRFNNNSEIELEFENGIDGKITLLNASIEYDEKYGFININGDRGSFKINTTLVYSYKKTEKEIYIDLDTLTIKIKKTN